MRKCREISLGCITTYNSTTFQSNINRKRGILLQQNFNRIVIVVNNNIVSKNELVSPSKSVKIS